jgi:hypothetical protein
VGSWGESGSGPGEFALPHDLIFLDEDTLLVTDRENYRLQFFDADGGYKHEWRVHHPLTVAPGVPGEGLLYVGELGPPPIIRNAPSLGHRVSIYDLDGQVVGHLGDPLPGHAATQFVAPHGIGVDSTGAVYVADVATSFAAYSWREEIPRGEARNLHKWTRSA